jgi:hypothetical protein
LRHIREGAPLLLVVESQKYRACGDDPGAAFVASGGADPARRHLCLEQNDKRLVGRRYLSADTTIDREEVRELTQLSG